MTRLSGLPLQVTPVQFWQASLEIQEEEREDF